MSMYVTTISSSIRVDMQVSQLLREHAFKGL
jgi:hypothetical protein